MVNCPGVIIAGAGPEEKRLKNLASGLAIEFTGSVAKVDDVFTKGKVFVLPSLSEGLPQTTLEAIKAYSWETVLGKIEDLMSRVTRERS